MSKLFVLTQSTLISPSGEWVLHGLMVMKNKAKINLKAGGSSKYEALCEMSDYLRVYDVDADEIIVDRRKSFGRRGRDARRSGDPTIP